MKNIDLTNVEAQQSGEFERPQAGGYIIQLGAVVDEPVKEYLRITKKRHSDSSRHSSTLLKHRIRSTSGTTTKERSPDCMSAVCCVKKST